MIALEPIPSTGTTEVMTFGRGGPVRESRPTWDLSPEGAALRSLRMKLGLDLRPAARALELLPSQLADLEAGRARPAAPTTWADLMAALWGAR